MAPESYHFCRQLTDPILNDSAACANLDIVAGHIYGGGLQSYPLAAEKGKEVWMTEHLILENDWSAALSTANDINACLSSGMSAYIWWYIVVKWRSIRRKFFSVILISKLSTTCRHKSSDRIKCPRS